MLTAGCHYSRSERRQRDRRRKETANKGPSLCGGEGRDEGPEEDQVMKTVEEEVKSKVTS